MKTKPLVLLSLLTAIALTIFIVEAQLPPLVAVPGIKMGLANIITLFALRFFTRRQAAAILFVRVVLGCLLGGQISALFYSLGGGFVCLAVESFVIRRVPDKQLWAVSVLGAIAHNITQLLIAALLISSPTVFWYLPALLAAGIITGAFTGLCVQAVVMKYHKQISRFIDQKSESTKKQGLP